MGNNKRNKQTLKRSSYSANECNFASEEEDDIKTQERNTSTRESSQRKRNNTKKKESKRNKKQKFNHSCASEARAAEQEDQDTDLDYDEVIDDGQENGQEFQNGRVVAEFGDQENEVVESMEVNAEDGAFLDGETEEHSEGETENTEEMDDWDLVAMEGKQTVAPIATRTPNSEEVVTFSQLAAFFATNGLLKEQRDAEKKSS